MRLKSLSVSLLLLLGLYTVTSAADFQPWTERVFVSIGQEYGAQAEKRMRFLHESVLANQKKSAQEKLRLVNTTMNRLPWIADKKHWEKVDYWASPMETLSTFGGDCDDIAIAKWIMLRYLGLSPEKLRLVYVKVKATGENHMVLAYVERSDLPREKRLESTWILDNLEQRVLRATQRTDLLVIYATDAEGNLVMFKDSGKGPALLGVHEKTKMARLEELKSKIKENMARYQEINEGRPLFSP